MLQCGIGTETDEQDGANSVSSRPIRGAGVGRVADKRAEAAAGVGRKGFRQPCPHDKRPTLRYPCLVHPQSPTHESCPTPEYANFGR